MIRSVFYLLFLLLRLSSNAQDTIAEKSKTGDSILRTIHLSSKALVKDNKILLQWAAVGQTDFYIIERSADEKLFEIIGVIKAKSPGDNFEFFDEKPMRAGNHYRIKMQVSNDRDIYSETVTASVADSIVCKFYPNPVDKLLMIRSESVAEVKITDITGSVRIVQKLKPGVQIMDVSSLEKNVYFITISYPESNFLITRKLLKN